MKTQIEGLGEAEFPVDPESQTDYDGEERFSLPGHYAGGTVFVGWYESDPTTARIDAYDLEDDLVDEYQSWPETAERIARMYITDPVETEPVYSTSAKRWIRVPVEA